MTKKVKITAVSLVILSAAALHFFSDHFEKSSSDELLHIAVQSNQICESNTVTFEIENQSNNEIEIAYEQIAIRYLLDVKRDVLVELPILSGTPVGPNFENQSISPGEKMTLRRTAIPSSTISDGRYKAMVEYISFGKQKFSVSDTFSLKRCP